MQKLLAMLLALCLVLGIAAAANAEVPADWAPFAERVKITVPVYDRSKAGYPAVDDNYWTQWIQKEFGDKYNIDVQYVAIPRGDVNILEEGADGESIMHYTVTYKNGAEIDRTLDWEEVLTAMVPQVYEIGVGGTIVGKDGTTYSYSWKRICSATYYNIYNYTNHKI